MSRSAQRRSRQRRAARSLLALGLAGALGVGLAGCSDEAFAQRYGTGDQGYVAGDGSWQEFPADQRGAPVAFQGPTETGETFDSASLAGRVAVVNFWYAACPPCRAEAADLQRVADEYAAQDVAFVGANIYDQAPTVRAFNDAYGVAYPSILDVESASVRIAFGEAVPPQAIPSTVVLDRRGRVAAVIRGPIDPSTLGAMLDRVLAEAA